MRSWRAGGTLQPAALCAMRPPPAPLPQVKVLQRGPVAGSEQHQITVVLDTSYMVQGKGIAEGSTVELHWCAARMDCCRPRAALWPGMPWRMHERMLRSCVLRTRVHAGAGASLQPARVVGRLSPSVARASWLHLGHLASCPVVDARGSPC